VSSNLAGRRPRRRPIRFLVSSWAAVGGPHALPRSAPAVWAASPYWTIVTTVDSISLAVVITRELAW
jgi:hypothetical protein